MKIIIAVACVLIGVLLFFTLPRNPKLDFTQFVGVDYVTEKENVSEYNNPTLGITFSFPKDWSYEKANSNEVSSKANFGILFKGTSNDQKDLLTLAVSKHSSVGALNGNTGVTTKQRPGITFAGTKIIPIETETKFNNNLVQYVTYRITKNGYDYDFNVYDDIHKSFSEEVQGILDSVFVR